MSNAMFYSIGAVSNRKSSMRFVHIFDDLEYARLCMDANRRVAGANEIAAAIVSIDRPLSRVERVELRNAVPFDAEGVRSTNPPAELHRLSRCHLASVRRDVMDLPARVGETSGVTHI